ncbi:MAG: hypothetical protein CL402_00755 [Acidiferrobacteraceae bacterium]|nr:hypothetical protein [Acidiferrobacteraceae bacterium]|tara:strand:- start:26780 stop:26992 length:213 start_codon:yes stop_codon:yes gene_type:complete
MGIIKNKRFRWIFIFCIMSVCLFIGVGGVLFSIQALFSMNFKNFFTYLLLAPIWVLGHRLLKKLLAEDFR